MINKFEFSLHNRKNSKIFKIICLGKNLEKKFKSNKQKTKEKFSNPSRQKKL